MAYNVTTHANGQVS
ncbi:hypothetical protein L0E72_01815 [Staphylococcus aureus]|nr:hypothetical protein [Staphylococcus aureus]MCF1844310.1 hypothetical protein [Staphylococcus aureus]